MIAETTRLVPGGAARRDPAATLRMRLYLGKRALVRGWLRLRARAIARKYRGYTMISRKRYRENLGLAALVADRPGCVVECGVWRGGMIAGLAEVLGARRTYYLFDSFEGLPPAQPLDGVKAKQYQENTTGHAYYDNCRAEMAFSDKAMRLAGARNVHFIKGWFNQTLPMQAPEEPIALLRLDGDWYDSTMVCLEALYEKVVPGGLIILDDYFYWEGCARAVHDFLSRRGIPDRIRQTPAGVCYLIRSEEPRSDA
ncbi:MAG: TylF/MycF/NovP-related O-methyltransferase [Vicinamibacterales bacterium]